MNNKIEHITFESETRQKIGAVTYIVAAFFDDKKEMLNHKISHLLKADIDRQISSRQGGHSQSGEV